MALAVAKTSAIAHEETIAGFELWEGDRLVDVERVRESNK